jgi:hypothetical protein
MRSLITCTRRKYNENNEVKEDKIGKAYSMHGVEEECKQGSGENTRRKETTKKT